MQIPNYEYQSDFAKKYFSEGKAQGKAQALLRFIAARGLPLSAEQRTTIEQCSDLERLDTWIDRAGQANSVSDILD